MIWEQLLKNQAKDYKLFLSDYKDALDTLNADITMLLGQHKEQSAPLNIKDKIVRDRTSWETLWGINGQKIEALRRIHQQELNAYFTQTE